MSDLNERAYLKDKFKDFGAASDPATKNAVMSEIQKERRKRRFFIIFFLSAFVGTIVVATIFSPTETDTKLTQKIKVENSKEIDIKTTNSNQDTNKSSFLNSKNQIVKNETRSKKQGNNNKKETSYIQKKFNSFESKNESLNKIIQTKQENTSTISEKDSFVRVSNESIPTEPKREISANSFPLEDKSKDDNIESEFHFEESKINELNIKQLSLPQSTDKHNELKISDQNYSFNSSNKWIIGLSYSYVDLRSETYDNEPVTPDNSSLNNNNSLIESSDFQRIKNSMNADLSIIRKFNNQFNIQSGLRYTYLNSVTSSYQMRDHLLGIPVKIGYNIPLKERWAIDLSTGINYNLSISRSEKKIDWKSKKIFGNFTDFHLSTAEFNIGISYFVSEKISVNLSPQLSYLLFYKEQSSKRYFHRNLWFGGQFGLLFHLL